MSEQCESEKTKAKLAALNTVGQQIHDSISFVDGKLTCQLQIGHPMADGSVYGCYSVHLLEFIVDLQKHYQNVLPSRESGIAIERLEEALGWMQRRKEDRSKRGVLYSDNL